MDQRAEFHTRNPGIIPGEETPLANEPMADIDLTLNCMAALRLMRPEWVIPSVSALNLAGAGTGYRRGLRTGANRVTINLTPSDVRAFQPAAAGAEAKINEFPSSGERREPFTALRRKIAERLVKSKQTAPHFAYVEEVEVTQLVALKDSLLPDADAAGVRLTYLPFIIKAVVAGLRKYPVLNTQLDEERREIVYRADCHIGLAVSTDQGLVVPVIKHAGQKSLLTLAQEIMELADKARSGKLSPSEVQGSTFTISSIGSIGGLFGIPIINYPEVAILGVNKVEKRPVVRTIDGEDRIVIREMLNLSIACDHRVVDGMEAALFIKEMAGYLENPGRLLLL